MTSNILASGAKSKVRLPLLSLPKRPLPWFPLLWALPLAGMELVVPLGRKTQSNNSNLEGVSSLPHHHLMPPLCVDPDAGTRAVHGKHQLLRNRNTARPSNESLGHMRPVASKCNGCSLHGKDMPACKTRGAKCWLLSR